MKTIIALLLITISCSWVHGQSHVVAQDTLRARADKALQEKPNQFQKTARLKVKLDSTRQRLQNRIDSLRGTPNPDTLDIASLESMRNKTDSIQFVLSGLSGNATVLPDQVENIQSAVQNLNAKMNEKLGLFAQNGATGLSTSAIPSSNLLNKINTPSLPNVSGPVTGLQGAVPNLPAAPGVNMPDANLSLPAVDVPSVPSVVNFGKAGDVFKDVSGYGSDVKALSDGNLDAVKDVPGKLEEKAMGTEQFHGMSKQISEVDKLKRYYDPDVAKEEALNKAKEEAVNHFVGHEEELKEAMNKLSELKAKKPDTEGVVDLFAKRQKPLQGKIFRERLIPGLSIQFQNQKSFWLDINPHVGYRVSGRFTAGIGWNQRLSYDFDHWKWDWVNRMYGPRSFVHFKFKENFYLKAEAEVMNAPYKGEYFTSGVEAKGRRWIGSYFAGIKRDFQFAKSLKGNVQVLYNLYNPDKLSPYVNRLNVRIGIDFLHKEENK